MLSLGMVLLVVTWRSSAHEQPASDPVLVAPHLKKLLESGGSVDFLVVLKEQADLSGVHRLSLKEDKTRFVRDSLAAAARRTQAPLLEYLERLGVSYHSFYLVNMVLVHGDHELVRALALRSDISRLEANPAVAGELFDVTRSPAEKAASVPWGLSRVHAPDVWAIGVGGEGIVVGGADTGVYWTHEALADKYRGKVGVVVDHNGHWHDAVNHAAEPYDDHGHGTMTLGTMVGSSPTEHLGMAPDAEWIACKNLDYMGYGTPARYIECFEFFLAPYPHGGDPVFDGDPALAPDVINNSWTCPTFEGCGPETLRSASDALRAAGIVNVAAAGNYGSSCSTVAEPVAIYDSAFTVGAFGQGDIIAGFSSRGPVIVDGSGRLKPDVAAPGVWVRSSDAWGGYSSSNGTSMAAPHVAGLVALMLSANGELVGQVDAIEEIIIEEADPKPATAPCGNEAAGDVPNNTWGHGIINAFAAAQSALDWTAGSPTPTSTPSSSPSPTWTVTPSATPAARVWLPVLSCD